MADLLIDTDVFVDVLRGAHLLERAGRDIAYSVVTRCELFAGRAAEEFGLRRFLDAFTEVEIDRAVAESAGRIRRGSGIATPDALIAASALAHGLPLMTRNRRHFTRVAGLRLETPA